MMNSAFVLEQSRHMATRVLDNAAENSDRVKLAYRLALSREPSEVESRRAIDYIEQTSTQSEDNNTKDSNSAWSAFCQVLLASAEFRYIE